ncbi:hypothetical protein DFH28DRAFT_1118233 [Melampsora americana]|nr:hypothetical protein DFH28DRAFT_1118233 [Melampsora americana]
MPPTPRPRLTLLDYGHRAIVTTCAAVSVYGLWAIWKIHNANIAAGAEYMRVLKIVRLLSVVLRLIVEALVDILITHHSCSFPLRTSCSVNFRCLPSRDYRSLTIQEQDRAIAEGREPPERLDKPASYYQDAFAAESK